MRLWHILIFLSSINCQAYQGKDIQSFIGLTPWLLLRLSFEANFKSEMPSLKYKADSVS